MAPSFLKTKTHTQTNWVFLFTLIVSFFIGPTSICDIVFLSNAFFYSPSLPRTHLLLFRGLFVVTGLFFIYFFSETKMYGFVSFSDEDLSLVPTAVQLVSYPELGAVYFFSTATILQSFVPCFLFFTAFNFLVTLIALFFSIKSNDEFSFFLQLLHLFALCLCPLARACFFYLTGLL